MHHHHDCEEEHFFPAIEQLAGVQGLMERNKEQHRAFTPGFEKFQEHVRTCTAAEYDGENLKKLVEGFAQPLIEHLHDEIDTLRALDEYDSVKVRQAYKQLEKLLMATDNVRTRWVEQKSSKSLTPCLVSNCSTCIWNSRPLVRRRHS